MASGGTQGPLQALSQMYKLTQIQAFTIKIMLNVEQ
jgi:hypothetical protein